MQYRTSRSRVHVRTHPCHAKQILGSYQQYQHICSIASCQTAILQRYEITKSKKTSREASGFGSILKRDNNFFCSAPLEAQNGLSINERWRGNGQNDG